MILEKTLAKEAEKDVKEELVDLARRYCVVYPDSVERIETEKYIGFRCLVQDDSSGITRGILERMGYNLEQWMSDKYWITLRARIEKRMKKK